MRSVFIALLCTIMLQAGIVAGQSVIRINQAGYNPRDNKTAVVASKQAGFSLKKITLVNTRNHADAGLRWQDAKKDFGRFGPFEHSFRVDFSSLQTEGLYQLIVNDTLRSDTIRVSRDVYHGMADFCLGFLRSSRYNNEAAVTGTGGKMGDHPGGSLPDTIPAEVWGGWHEANGRGQDIMTGAVITGYLLAAYERYPYVFNDDHDAAGALQKNSRADIADEARWGLDWLIKMHPAPNKIYLKAEDNDSAATGSSTRSGQEQGPTDLSLISTVFSEGATLFEQNDPNYADRLKERAVNTYQWAAQPGMKEQYAQSLAAEALFKLTHDRKYQPGLPISRLTDDMLFAGYSKAACQLLRNDLEAAKDRAAKNAFAFPFDFSENANTSLINLAVKSLQYRQICGDSTYDDIAQSAIGWLLGCNPWGVVMISSLPARYAVAHPFNTGVQQSLAGGVVNGPVKSEVYKTAKGASLLKKDSYQSWQSPAAVYHDDAADFVTNQPSPQATAALIFLLASREDASLNTAPTGLQYKGNLVIRGDSSQKKLAIVFTGLRNGNAAKTVSQILVKEKVRASFFLTPAFLKQNGGLAKQLRGRNYVGAAGAESWWSCCDSFSLPADYASVLQENQLLLKSVGASSKITLLPGNDPASSVSTEGFLITPTPGTLGLRAAAGAVSPLYVNSDSIFQNIIGRARQMPYGLNGYFLVLPTDVPADRPDKFYMLLPLLFQDLKNEGYELVRADEMLGLKAPPVETRKPATTARGKKHRSSPAKKHGSTPVKRKRKK